MDHIPLNLGNVLFITAVSITGIVVTLAVVHMLSKADVPVLSPTARGSVDFLNKVAA